MVTSFLDTLSPADRTDLEALFQTVTYDDGQTLFRQGDQSEGAFIVEEGEIALDMVLPGGARHSVATVGPGGFVGEPAWLTSATRTLDARASGPVKAHYIDALDFRGLLSAFRPGAFRLTREIARIAADRIRRTEARIAELDRPARPIPASGKSEANEIDFDPRPFLPAFPFFEDFTRRDVDMLLGMADVVEMRRGHVVARAGEPGGCLFLLRGAAEALVQPRGFRVRVLGPGDLHGQDSNLLGCALHGDLRIREQAVGLRLDAEACQSLFEPRGRLSYKFTKAACIATLKQMEQTNRVLARESRLASLQRASQAVGSCGK